MHKVSLFCLMSLLGIFGFAQPAEAVPVTGACCNSSLECIDNETLESCQALGNGFAGIGSSCTTENLCNNLVGACCSDDNCSFGKWTACMGADQTFAGANTSCDDPGVCSPPVGACCHAGGCSLTDAASCQGDGYHYAGDYTACVEGSAAPQCPDQVACCIDGTCSDMSPEMCASQNGTDVGDCDDPWPTCAAPAPTGACCTPEGCNDNVTQDVCTRGTDNTWAGANTSCDDVGVCGDDELGACCYSDGCMNQRQEECNGTWQGVGTSCDDVGICVEDELGACCLSDGTCQDVTNDMCDELSGQWLEDDDCDSATVTGAPQSTGWDTFEIGNWTGSGITLYDNGNETPIAWVDYIQWISVNAPNAAFNTYYFQTLYPASQTAPNWLCAGNVGNRLQKVFQVHLGDHISDAALQGKSYSNFAALRDDVAASAYYSNTVNASSDWNAVYGAIGNVGGNIWGSSGSFAKNCVETPTIVSSQCPIGDVLGACCLPDGTCLDLDYEKCVYEGGNYAGDGTSCYEALDAGTCEPPPTGACCVDDTCSEQTAELCHRAGGLYYGDGTQCIDGDRCPDSEEPALGACCLPSGQCVDATEEECLRTDGLWLDDESCDDAITSTGGTLVSTGWDNTALGNFDLGAASPILAPFGSTPTSTQEYLQWLSINEPNTQFRTYYYQNITPAIQTAAANWQCAGDVGNRLQRTYVFKLRDIADLALVDTSYQTIADLRAAMMASSYYPSVNIGSTFEEIYDSLLEANAAANIGSTIIYSISGQVAQDCVDIEYGDFQCPMPQACCVDGACLEMNATECERMGGQIVGDDCDDPDIDCEGEDPGACCVEGACVQVGIEICEERYQGIFYSDTDQCIEECRVDIGGCCLPNGDCIDMEEYKCLTSSGVWLGAGESCEDVDAGPAAGGNIISTGWNNYLIGNLDTGYNPPVLYPLGSVVTSTSDYLQWISVNEPSTNFRTYYYQSTSTAIQTAAANWHCAGDQGNKLTKTYMVKIFDVLDTALAGTTYYNFTDLRDALMGSASYNSTITAASDWTQVHETLMAVGVDPDSMNASPYGIYGQNAHDCFTVEDTGFQCPIPEACCVDGACFDLTAEECEERGGQIVGDDCDDTTLICEPVDEGACCYQGSCVAATPSQCEDPMQGVYYTDSAQCLADCVVPTGVCCLPNGTCNPNWDEYHCELAGGSWLADETCDANDAGLSQCPQPDTIACCIDGTCFEMTVEECEERGGRNVGDDCDDPDIVCGTPVGACCTEDGQCLEIDEDKCKHILGTYQGDGTECDDVTCTPYDAGPCGDPDPVVVDEPRGACCKGENCEELTAVECAESNGLWGGANSTCDEEDICGRVTTSSSDDSSGGLSCQSSGTGALPLWGMIFLLGAFRRRRR